VIQATGVAVVSMAEAAEGLTVDAARMKENLKTTHGTIFAEKAALLLSPKIGREAAHELIERATDSKQMRGRTLSEVLAEMPDIRQHLAKDALAHLEYPQDYLGSANAFIRRLSGSAKKPRRGGK
jgi:3-carboxy-cis,cis-muconate cycloisomerase